MVWGCMTVHGVGNLFRIDGGLDSNLYRRILDEDLVSSVEDFGFNVEDVVFQHDNDPKHTSRIVKQWISERQIAVLDWPAQSPDLNPIEHLWGHLKRRMCDYNDSPTSIHSLWERLELEWHSIPASVCRELIESMPRRVSAVLGAKGGYTKY